MLLWAIAVRRRWDTLAASTQYLYRCRLYRQLEEVLALAPTQSDGIRLQNRYRDLREKGRDLFADVRSIVNTGKRQGLSAFQAISHALNPAKSLFSLS